MLQNDQSRAKVSERAVRKEQRQQHKTLRTGAPQALTLAIQAVQAGVPLTHLPPAQLLALSARIGNSALLALMAQQQGRNEFTPAVLPAGEAKTEPMTVAASPLDAAASPDWAALPALQTAPAEASGLNTQGGVAFAGS